MNFKTTGLLLALVVAGGLAIWLFPSGKDRDSSGENKPPQTGNQPLIEPALAEKDVVAVAIERPGKPRLAFERAPKTGGAAGEYEDWRMTEPLAAPAEQGMVGNVVRQYAQLQTVTRFEPGSAGAVSAADAGVDAPRASVVLKSSAGKEYRIEVGRKVGLGNDTYVRLAGSNSIGVSTGDLFEQLNRDANNYRARTLFKLVANDAVAVEIEHEGKQFELRRGADKQWVMNSPLKAFAEPTKVTGLVSKLAMLRASEFVDTAADSPASYGFDAPFLKVRVTTELQRPIPTSQPAGSQPAEQQFETVTNRYEVVVGGFADMKSEYRFAQVAGQPGVVTIPKGSIEGLIPKTAELLDPRVTRVKAAEISKLTITTGDQSATLERVNNVWQGSGDLAALEVEAVADVVNALEDLKAVDYADASADGGKYGLDKPRAVLEATTTAAVAPLTLKIGANTASGRNAYAQVEGQSTVYVIAAAQADRLAVSPLSLRSRAIFNCRVDAIGSLAVTRGERTVQLANQGGNWSIVEPADTPVDAATVRQVVNDLSKLRARRVVAKGDAAAFGLDEPGLTVRFTVAATPPATQASQPVSAPSGAPAEHTLRVARKDRLAYCRLDDDPFVFELDETVYKLLSSELVKGEIFSFAPDTVIDFAVVAPQGSLQLSKDGKEWRDASDPTVKIASKKVTDFLAELSKMRVESYIAYRDGDLTAEGLDEKAPVKVTIRLLGDQEIKLHIGQQQPNTLPRKAALVGERRIFVLREGDAEKFLRGIDYYIDTGEKPAAPGQPNRPPQLPPGVQLPGDDGQ